MAVLQGELARLVESERRLDAELVTARAEAAELVRRAREAGAALRHHLEDDLVAASARLRATREEEQLTELATIQADARRQVERFDAASPERVAELARLVADRLVAGLAS